MNDQTLGRLWVRYLKTREELSTGEGLSDDTTRRKMERQGGHLRDRLLINYSPLVKYVAGRLGARMIKKAMQQDLISWGLLGLLDAIETYEPNRRTLGKKRATFETYATSKIRWAILDELRKQDWVPRRLRQRAQEVEKAKTGLKENLRRPPTEDEIAAQAGMEVAEYHGFLDQYSRAQVGSLDTTRVEGEENSGAAYGTLIEDSSAVNPQTQANIEEVSVQLADEISKLNERERLVTTFYFYEQRTLKEIGKAIELTEGRVSQILKEALTKLQKSLEGSGLRYESWQDILD